MPLLGRGGTSSRALVTTLVLGRMVALALLDRVDPALGLLFSKTCAPDGDMMQ